MSCVLVFVLLRVSCFKKIYMIIRKMMRIYTEKRLEPRVFHFSGPIKR